jgi:hypothetical protein
MPADLFSASPIDVGAASFDTTSMMSAYAKAVGHGFIIPAPFDMWLDVQTGNDGEDNLFQRLADDIRQDQYDEFLPFPGLHLTKQVVGSPWSKTKPWIMKMRGFWYMETPPGYSCLFLSPQLLSGGDAPFYALPGMVETDRYKNLIMFPMIPLRPFPFSLKEGTPLIHVLPFKRNDWTAEIGCTEP